MVLTLALAGMFSTRALAQPVWDFPQPHPVGDPNVATQVVLRTVTGIYAAQPPPITVSVPPTGAVTFSLGLDDNDPASVTWFKDGEPLPATARTLTLTKVTASDAGLYTAQVRREVDTPVIYGQARETVRLDIGNPTPCRLVNISSRTTISAANPALIVGFVVGGNDRITPTKHLLIRAIGPSLVGLGVPKTLTRPQVTLYDSRGHRIEWPEVWIPEWNPYELAHVVAPRVGAMPLEPDAGDFAILYAVPPGAYTAHVSSGDGDDGDVLLEIFEVPNELLPTMGDVVTAEPKP